MFSFTLAVNQLPVVKESPKASFGRGANSTMFRLGPGGGGGGRGAFEMRQVSDVGTRHPAVARLGVQTGELTKWLDVEPPVRDAVNGLYIETLMPTLLECHRIYDELREDGAAQVHRFTEANDPRAPMPHILRLRPRVENYLYNAKNYLRDLLQVFKILDGCELDQASHFADLKEKGQSELAKWATAKFGATDSLTEMLASEVVWTDETIKKRNAVEHPGGYSGSLEITNVEEKSDERGMFFHPTWNRTGEPASDLYLDMNTILHNLLSLAEDVLADAVLKHTPFGNLLIEDISADQRDPACPIRLRVTANLPPPPAPAEPRAGA
ncbi:MAG: hypothetical protein IPK59_12895 [Rhodospirillaceae bacterium]|nr:hypothetical protein [Rhodospirillaceae bacterium]